MTPAPGPQSDRHGRLKSAAMLLVCFVLVFAAARLGSMLTTPNLDWYATLAKPWFTPPNWAFPVAWTILFTLMAIALFWVWKSLHFAFRAHPALVAFAVQLVLNIGWSFAFFHGRDPLAGLVVIGLLFAAIIWTLLAFRRVEPGAALLLVPYPLWVGYAALLNASIYWLNGPGA